jgi:hypothetical protein
MHYPEPESSTLEWKREFPRGDQIGVGLPGVTFVPQVVDKSR